MVHATLWWDQTKNLKSSQNISIENNVRLLGDQDFYGIISVLHQLSFYSELWLWITFNHEWVKCLSSYHCCCYLNLKMLKWLCRVRQLKVAVGVWIAGKAVTPCSSSADLKSVIISSLWDHPEMAPTFLSQCQPAAVDADWFNSMCVMRLSLAVKN